MSSVQAFFETYVKQAFPEPEKILYAGTTIYYPMANAFVFKITLNYNSSYSGDSDYAYGFSFQILHKFNGLIDSQHLTFKDDFGLPRYSLTNHRWFDSLPQAQALLAFENNLYPLISKYMRLWTR